MKLKVRMVIPEYLVPMLEENDELVRRLEQENRTRIAFSRDNETKVSTCEGVKGGLTNISGKLDNVMKTMQDLFLEIMTLEQQVNGKRKI